MRPPATSSPGPSRFAKWRHIGKRENPGDEVELYFIYFYFILFVTLITKNIGKEEEEKKKRSGEET